MASYCKQSARQYSSTSNGVGTGVVSLSQGLTLSDLWKTGQLNQSTEKESERGRLLQSVMPRFYICEAASETDAVPYISPFVLLR